MPVLVPTTFPDSPSIYPWGVVMLGFLGAPDTTINAASGYAGAPPDSFGTYSVLTGQLVIAGLVYNSGGGHFTISDSAGNDWHSGGEVDLLDGWGLQLFYCTANADGPLTVSTSCSANGYNQAFWETFICRDGDYVLHQIGRASC